MRRTLAIAVKEIYHIVRDFRTLVISILWPVMMMLIFGYAIDMDMKNLEVGILDLDHSPDSRNFITEMTSSSFIVESAQLNSRREIEIGFRRNRFRAVLIFPQGYGKSLLRDPSVAVQLIVDGADGSTAVAVDNYLRAVIARLNLKYLEEIPGQSTMLVDVRPRFLFNPELISAHFIVPGLSAVVMMMICALLTSIALTREKETGTMEQILTTPVAAWQVIIGKLLPYSLLASLDAFLIFMTGAIVFQVPMYGSWLALAGYSAIYLLIALSLGLFISTMVKTQQVALMFALIVTLLPTVLLSGFIFPISSMPKVLQYFCHIIPATYFLEIIRSIMLKGVNWHPVNGAILLGIALMLIVISISRFKDKLE